MYRVSRALWLCAALVIASPAASVGAESYEQSIAPFKRALARICPAKHLENLSPGFLEIVIDDYLRQQPAREEERIQRAAQPICVGSVAGVSCGNIGYIRAARKLRLTTRLAKAACESGYVCSTEFADCMGVKK
jgi:hypothetical protein